MTAVADEGASLSAPRRLDPEARAEEVRRVLRSVLWMNLGLVGLKVGAFVSSGALSIVAETVHSSLDASNNVFALWMARVAGQEPDERHPYGHQKFETLGALALVGFLSITVFELAQRAISMLVGEADASVAGTPVAIALMGVSVVAGLAITTYESRRGRALGSDLLLADAAHTRADVLSTLAVLGGLVAIRLGWPEADPWIALLVAALVARTGWQILQESVPVLVDERAVDAARIRSIAENHPDVHGAYGIRSRGRPGEVFAELTIALDPELDVLRSHAIADEVEARVASVLEAREVVVHVEPAG